MALQSRSKEGAPGTRGPVGRRTAAALAVLALAGTLGPSVGVDLVPAAEASHLEAPEARRLPNWRMYASSVWDGRHAYVIGGLTGWGSFTNEILRYDPVSGALTSMGARLPQAPGFHGTVWTGTHAYVFLESGTIARFDPARDRVDVMGARLPGRWTTTVAWDGQHMYIFGGAACFPGNHDILRYDPARDVVELMGATTPGGPHPDLSGWGFVRGHAVAHGGAIYVIGGEIGTTVGNSCGASSTNTIYRYDPATDRMTVALHVDQLLDLHPYLMRAPVLTAGGQQHSVAWDGERAWIFSGDQLMTRDPTLCERPFFFWAGLWQCPSPPLVYEPATNRIWMHCHGLPRVNAAAVWAGDQVLVFSGEPGTNTFHPSQGWMMPREYEARELIFHHDRKCAPVALIRPSAPIECDDRGGTHVVDGSRSYDPDGDPVTYHWSGPGTSFGNAASAKPTARLPYGDTAVRLTLRDARGQEGSTQQGFKVVDTLPPVARMVRPQPGYAYVFDVAEAMHGGHAGAADIVAVGPLTVVAAGEDRCGVEQMRFHGSDGSSAVDDQEAFSFRMDPSLHHTVKMRGDVRVHATAVDFGGNTHAAVVDLVQVSPAAPCLRLVPSLVCAGPGGLWG